MHVSRVGAGGGRGGIKATMCVRGPGGGGGEEFFRFRPGGKV